MVTPPTPEVDLVLPQSCPREFLRMPSEVIPRFSENDGFHLFRTVHIYIEGDNRHIEEWLETNFKQNTIMGERPAIFVIIK